LESGVRVLTLAIVAASNLAAADELPIRSVEVAIGASTYSDGIGGVGEHGTGAVVEAAFGADRVQALVEGSREWVVLDNDSLAGRRTRGGVGLRWLPRRFSHLNRQSIDLVLEATAGLARTAWNSGGSVTRPDLGFGWGAQYRVDGRGVHLGLRVMLRATFAPTERDQMAVVCRGQCMAPPHSESAGLQGLVEVTW
jgi:hypothetical protein